MAIRFSGEFEVKKRPEEVYDFLTDPNRFAPLLPEFQSLLVQDATHFTVKVNVGISYIKGSADVKMELSEADRPRRAQYKGQGDVAGGGVTMVAGFDLAPSAGGVADSSVPAQGAVVAGANVPTIVAVDPAPGADGLAVATVGGLGADAGGNIATVAAVDSAPTANGVADATVLGTKVNWQGEAQVFGRLTSVAGGLLQPLAKKQIQKLIDGLQAALG
jgi:carbon monoxide dehydrogenase subunit G